MLVGKRSRSGLLWLIIAGQGGANAAGAGPAPSRGPRRVLGSLAIGGVSTIGASAVAMGYAAGRPLPAGGGQGSGANNVIGVAFILYVRYRGRAAGVEALIEPDRLAAVRDRTASRSLRIRAVPPVLQANADVRPVVRLDLAGRPRADGVRAAAFPAGSLPSRRWRIVAWAAVTGIGCWIAGNAFAPHDPDVRTARGDESDRSRRAGRTVLQRAGRSQRRRDRAVRRGRGGVACRPGTGGPDSCSGSS